MIQRRYRKTMNTTFTIQDTGWETIDGPRGLYYRSKLPTDGLPNVTVWKEDATGLTKVDADIYYRDSQVIVHVGRPFKAKVVLGY